MADVAVHHPMAKVPGLHIAIAIPRSPEVEVGPVDLSLSGPGGVEGGAGVAMQKHVIPGCLAGLGWGGLRHGAATASGARQQSGTSHEVPEQLRAAATGILGHEMTDGLEQDVALDRRQRGAADRQLGEELLCGEPGVRGRHRSRGCPCGVSGGGYPRGQTYTHTITGWLV